MATYLLNIRRNKRQALSLQHPNQKYEQDCIDCGANTLVEEEFCGGVGDREMFGCGFTALVVLLLCFDIRHLRGESVFKVALVEVVRRRADDREDDKFQKCDGVDHGELLD